MSRLDTIMVLAALAKLCKRGQACQVDPNTWVADRHLALQSPIVSMREVLNNAERYGMELPDAPSDHHCELLRQSRTVVIRVRHPHGYEIWALPSTSTLKLGMDGETV